MLPRPHVTGLDVPRRRVRPAGELLVAGRCTKAQDRQQSTMLDGGRIVRPLVAWRSAAMLTVSRWRPGTTGSSSRGRQAVRMGGTAAGPSPRAVAAGLAVALLVLLVAGRLQQRVLAPQPSVPARPLAVTPTTTIPPIPVTARISIRVDDVVALATAAGEVWALGPRELLRVDPDDNRVTARIRIPGPAAFDGGGWRRGPARCGLGPVSGQSGSTPGGVG